MDLFFSVDWGTSSFRIRLVKTDLTNIKILSEVKSNLGISVINQSWINSNKNTSRLNFFIDALGESLKEIKSEFDLNIDTIPLIISGMASSSIGMVELPYSPLPFELNGSNLNYKIINTNELTHPILLLSGIKSDNDIMRGEETQLLGCYNSTNKADGIYILPGTHSKHIKVSNGKAISFKTFMTGEMYQLLTNYSILKNSTIKSDTINNSSFILGVRHIQENNLLGSLFNIRANEILNGIDKEANSSFLSGLLIGSELLELTKTNLHIYLCAHENLSKNYILALEELSLINKTTVISSKDVDDSVVVGHLYMKQRYFDT